MNYNRWRCLICLATLCWGSLVFGQAGKARLEGRVTKDGKGVGAVVVLVVELRLTEVTDEGGSFVFDSVPEGRYTVILTFGDNTETRENVFVTAGETRTLELEVDWDVGVTEKVTVTAAARAAKIVDAPAAVTAIPEEQIERQAAHGQVPKILEFTPGAEITQSGLYDFNFNTRGFNSSLNRRVSTYIDGRDVGVVLLGAQEWAAISGGLDDVASLEFIRGPSAALYGANASSGVVNITTKAPRDSLGTMLRMTSGQLDTASMDFRRADDLGNGWYGKVIAGFKNSGDFSISRNPDGPDNISSTEDDLENPEYSEFCLLIGETDCLPEEKTLFREQDNEIRYASVRIDKYLADDSLVTFELGGSDIEGPVFQTGIGRVQANDARRPFYRFSYAADRWNILAHYAEREGDQANLIKDLLANFALLTDTKRYGIEGQANWTFGRDERGRFVLGAAHTEERVDTVNPDTGLQTVVFEPIDSNRQAIFSQFDWKLNDHIKFVAAGRMDRSTLHDTQFSPKAAMVYSINPQNSIRLTYNQAFQVANYSEYFLHTRIAPFPLGPLAESGICPVWGVDCDSLGYDENGNIPILAVGNDDLRLEKTKAWEIGYSGLLGRRVFVTVDYYNAKNEDFITDLVPQVGTILGDPADSFTDTDGCVDERGNPQPDPTECPINTDYLPWVGSKEWETTYFVDPVFPENSILAADALRAAVDGSVGGETLGFRLARDLDGSTVVIGRTYTNVGQVDTQGVDFGLQYFITEDLSVQTSYSWFDFEILETNVPEDPRCELPQNDQRRPLCIEDILLPNSPEHKASVAISYARPRWSVGLGARWVEGFRWSAGVFQGDVPDYSTVDLSASYGFTESIRLGMNVANLRDTVHRQTFGGDLLSRRALINLSFEW